MNLPRSEDSQSAGTTGRFIARRWLVLIVLLWFQVAPRADLAELPVSADTGILEYSPDFNLGAQVDVPAGTLGTIAGEARSRMLLRFDIEAGLPAGATIQAAFLTLTVARVPAGPSPSGFGLHRITVAWQEGDKQGASPGGAGAGPGETTWNERRHGQETWREPGGRLGEDFDATASATEMVEGLGEYEFEFGAKGVADIQGWLSDPARNHGWALIAEDETTARTARRFATRESGKGAVLVVRFAGPAAAPRITGFEVRGTEMILRFLGEAGQPYVWEGAEAIAGGAWETIALLEAVETAGERSMTNAWPARPQQFFRLQTNPLP